MKRILLVQHEAFEPFGTLDPLLKREGIRIRYVNFDREPEARPSLDSVDGLVLMGGEMSVYQAQLYPHLGVEMRLVEDALKRDLPVLGICLGAQIIAHVLGARVARHQVREMGWQKIRLTNSGLEDPVLAGFRPEEFVFQSHGDAFEIPQSAEHLIASDLCEQQGFRYGKKVYGFQFHLEMDRPTIQHWLDTPFNADWIQKEGAGLSPERVWKDTDLHLDRSVELSERCFLNFLRLAGARPPRIRLGSGR
jgi:GMP synthase (glutamine-hydrolysing)